MTVVTGAPAPLVLCRVELQPLTAAPTASTIEAVPFTTDNLGCPAGVSRIAAAIQRTARGCVLATSTGVHPSFLQEAAFRRAHDEFARNAPLDRGLQRARAVHPSSAPIRSGVRRWPASHASGGTVYLIGTAAT